MKLRLRSLRSGEIYKLEVPNESSLQQLKETLILAVSSPSLPSSLHFSMNKKDEIFSSSMQDSLQSLGITSGDLIYFTQNPDGFSRSLQTHFQESGESFVQELRAGCDQSNFKELGSKEIEISQELEIIGLNSPNQETASQDSSVKETVIASDKETIIQDLKQPVVSSTQLGETVENNQEVEESVDGMDIDSSGSVDGLDYKKRISEPSFLKRVLMGEEFGDDFSDNKLLFIAIHAVFLESGFVGFDSVSGLRVDLFHLLEEQRLMNFTTSVSYTLPQLLDTDNVIDSVVLKFQTLGQFVVVYGSLAKTQSLVHISCLDKCIFVPPIGSIWANCDKSDLAYENDSYTETVVFELWKIVKDQLAMPLLIELCEKNGLDLPPCLMLLPADVKLKILESLPGADVAKMACVCKDMQYLSSNNDLWKQKFTEEFGSKAEPQQMIDWKKNFVSSWNNRKRKRVCRPLVNCQMIEHSRLISEQIRLRNEQDRFPIAVGVGGAIVSGDYNRFGQPGRVLSHFNVRYDLRRVQRRLHEQQHRIQGHYDDRYDQRRLHEQQHGIQGHYDDRYDQRRLHQLRIQGHYDDPYDQQRLHEQQLRIQGHYDDRYDQRRLHQLRIQGHYDDPYDLRRVQRRLHEQQHRTQGQVL